VLDDITANNAGGAEDKGNKKFAHFNGAVKCAINPCTAGRRSIRLNGKRANPKRK
jgi:hypothetical protein